MELQGRVRGIAQKDFRKAYFHRGSPKERIKNNCTKKVKNIALHERHQ